MHIRPLTQLSLAEVDDLARAAADRGEPHYSANPYPAGTAQHERYLRAYTDRQADLQIDTAAA
ncbi:hypothetical protein [Pseudorhodoferax aquiterrae]|nr:hypothetical protein [Pseudorhodoferax aquiterrae]